MQNCCYLSVTPLLTVRNNSSHSPYPLCEVSIIVTHIMSSRWRGYDQTAWSLWHHYLIILRLSRTELRCVSAWANRYHVFPPLCGTQSLRSDCNWNSDNDFTPTDAITTLHCGYVVTIFVLFTLVPEQSSDDSDTFLLMRSRTWAPFRHERKCQ